MIRRFLHKGLTALDAAQTLRELDVPGWRLHQLHGEPVRFAISVNGPWRITFEWADGDALRVDLEQYH
jgi:proteic killer suppression protein